MFSVVRYLLIKGAKIDPLSPSQGYSISAPLLTQDQQSHGPIYRTSEPLISPDAVVPRLPGIQNDPEFKLADTLRKLRQDSKFLEFYSRVDKNHFNRKLKDFLSGVDTFTANTKKGKGVFGNFHQFTLLDAVNTNKKFCYKASSSESGLYEYIPETQTVCLIDGTKIYPDGAVEEGKRAYISETKAICLIDGKMTYPGRAIEEGKRAYNSEMKGICLIDGTKTYLDGKGKEEGKFAYIPEMQTVCLIDGKTTFPDGTVEEGKFAYIPERLGVGLIDGKVTFPDGTVERIVNPLSATPAL